MWRKIAILYIYFAGSVSGFDNVASHPPDSAKSVLQMKALWWMICRTNRGLCVNDTDLVTLITKHRDSPSSIIALNICRYFTILRLWYFMCSFNGEDIVYFVCFTWGGFSEKRKYVEYRGNIIYILWFYTQKPTLKCFIFDKCRNKC